MEGQGMSNIELIPIFSYILYKEMLRMSSELYSSTQTIIEMNLKLKNLK